MRDQEHVAVCEGDLIISGVTIPCAVLDDGTRVLSQRALLRTIGSGRPGGRQWKKSAESKDGVAIPVFLTAGNIKPFISNELAMASSNIYPYRSPKGGHPSHGIEAKVLPMICDVWLKARDAGALLPSQIRLAQNADILMRGLAHIGIIGLVDEATGYQNIRGKLALHEILEKFIAKELRPWIKTFPDEFYEHLFRLRGWKFVPFSVKRPAYVGTLTNDLVYARLAPLVLEALKREIPIDPKTGKRKGHLHRKLSEEVGYPKLKEHLSNVIVLMRISKSWNQLLSNLAQAKLTKFNETIDMLEQMDYEEKPPKDEE